MVSNLIKYGFGLLKVLLNVVESGMNLKTLRVVG